METIEYLKKHQHEILEDAKDGNKKAKRIIEFYHLFHAYAEPIALAFLQISIDEYNEEKKKF